MSSYIPIASQTLTSSASSVTFTSIPTTLNGKTLRDLVLIIEAISPSSTGDNLVMEFNTDTTSSNYYFVTMEASSIVNSRAETGTTVGRVDTGKVLNIVQIFDYQMTDKYKSALVRWNEREEYIGQRAYRWANTASINRIDFKSSFGFAAGSTFSLYGIEG